MTNQELMDRQWRFLSFDLDKIAVATRPCHWISTPRGDHGREWCPDCGHAKVRNMRRHDRRRRSGYILDGGWRTEHDYMPMCAGCGSYLDGAMTRYAIDEQIEYYREYGLSTDQAVDALYLSEVITNIDEEDTEGVDLAVRLAREVLDTAGRRALDQGGDRE